MRGFMDLGLESLGHTLSSHWGFQKATRLLAGVLNHWHPHPAMSEGPQFCRFSPTFPITAIPVGVRWHLNVLPTPNSAGRLLVPEPQPGRRWPSSFAFLCTVTIIKVGHRWGPLTSSGFSWTRGAFPHGWAVLGSWNYGVGFPSLQTAQLLFLSVLAVSLLSPLVSLLKAAAAVVANRGDRLDGGGLRLCAVPLSLQFLHHSATFSTLLKILAYLPGF